MIVTKLATSQLAIDDYVRKTLLYHTSDRETLQKLVETTLLKLQAGGLIVTSDDSFESTLLGQAIVAASLTPADGTFVHSEFRRALHAFVMDGEMHVLYSFTPVQSFQTDVNWQIFQKEMESLDESGLRVMSFVGVKPTMINKL